MSIRGHEAKHSIVSLYNCVSRYWTVSYWKCGDVLWLQKSHFDAEGGCQWKYIWIPRSTKRNVDNSRNYFHSNKGSSTKISLKILRMNITTHVLPHNYRIWLWQQVSRDKKIHERKNLTSKSKHIVKAVDQPLKKLVWRLKDQKPHKINYAYITQSLWPHGL